MNQFVAMAVAEKLAVMRTAAFFSERSGRADLERFRGILTRPAGEKPRPDDEWPLSSEVPKRMTLHEAKSRLHHVIRALAEGLTLERER